MPKLRNLRKGGGVLQLIYDFLKDKLTGYSSEKIIIYDSIVESAKKYEEFINWNLSYVPVYNAVVKLSDEYLSVFALSRDMSQYALSTVKLANFCESLDVKFFYVSLPHKICVSQDKDVSGTLDFSNQNADKFFAVLKDSGVKYYDLRKNLHDQGMNHHEAFFITDHHWRPESGLWAAREILKFLREDYNWPVKPEILNPENFDYVIYHDWFLGSHGKKLTLARTKLENITMIYPKFDTYLNYEIPNLNINLSGDFSIMYDMSCITKHDYYNLSAYGAYNYGGQSLIRFTNLLAASNRKILVIDDSFGNCVLPFLALGVKNVAEIDLRGFNGSLKNYIASERPDLVIVMYYINHLGGAKFFDFR